VNFTLSHLTPTGTQSSSAIVWFSPSGIPEISQLGVRNFTGDGAQASSLNFTTPFVAAFSYVELLLNNSTSLSHFRTIGQDSTQFGPTQMNVVEYNVPGPFRSIRANLTIYGVLLNVGAVGGQGQRAPVRILTYEAIKSSQGLFVFTLLSVKE